VSVIRAEETAKGVPPHIVSVQGGNWTSNISVYSTYPISGVNIVYEYHGYEPNSVANADGGYTYSNIPVIVGEYGAPLPDAGEPFDASAFYTNVENNHIPNLAYDVDPFNAINYDLVQVNDSATNLDASVWGTVVQTYLERRTG